MRWTGAEPPEGSGLRFAALSFYLALMTETCLRLTGANGPTIIEGPFARNSLYVEMLAAATGRSVSRSQSATGTSIGAALLFGHGQGLVRPDRENAPRNAAQLGNYAEQWRLRVEGNS